MCKRFCRNIDFPKTISPKTTNFQWAIQAGNGSFDKSYPRSAVMRRAMIHRIFQNTATGSTDLTSARFQDIVLLAVIRATILWAQRNCGLAKMAGFQCRRTVRNITVVTRLKIPRDIWRRPAPARPYFVVRYGSGERQPALGGSVAATIWIKGNGVADGRWGTMRWSPAISDLTAGISAIYVVHQRVSDYDVFSLPIIRRGAAILSSGAAVAAAAC